MTDPLPLNINRSLLLLSLATGFLLRLLNLGSESFWYDETVSVYLAGKSVPDLIAHTAGDIHPPGYYLLLQGWRGLAQPSQAHGLEFLFAWPSLFAGLLIVALLYPIGRRLFGPKTALIAVWLAALSPFQIWYSQEVRMYSVAGALGLLALWSMLQFLAGRRSWLIVYVAAGTVGLYTLYYFAFLLVALNLAAAIWIWTAKDSTADTRLRRTGIWITAQIGVVVLWLPWATVFWRQITDPPVPPWREPWQTPGAVVESLSEGMSALLSGQSPPGTLYWPWAVVAVMLTALFLILPIEVRAPGNRVGMKKSIVLLFVFGPMILIYTLSLLVTPLYHVRYLAAFAAPFSLVAGSVVASLYMQKRALLGGGLLSLLVLVSILSLAEFWSNPRYRADDHRQAVATLAAEWRPGDVILANAGWIYPIIDVYWPTGLDSSQAVVPPELDDFQRIIDYTKSTSSQPLVVRTGSVDGPPSLGWGNPKSDFFAASTRQSIEALTRLAANHPRIWHYRVYDTVSDPDGALRQALNQLGSLRWEQPIPGRDLGLLQLYETDAPAPTQPPAIPVGVSFGDAVRLEQFTAPSSINAGSPLYVDLLWRATPNLAALPAELAMSLRLYDHTGSLALQVDSPPLQPTREWQPEQQIRQPLALPVPVDTKPGAYSLQLVTYEQDSGEPLPPDDPAATIQGQRLILGKVAVELADQAPSGIQAMASFDYIDLVDSQVPSTPSPSAPLHVELSWRPRPSDYRDTYLAQLTLVDPSGVVAANWSRPLGGDAYPSGDWPPLFPVRDSFDLVLPGTVTPGTYEWRLRVERASDGAPIPARQNWQTHDEIQLGAITLRQ